MKLLFIEAFLVLIILGCILELVYLGWLSATPITPHDLSVITLEFYVTLTMAFLALATAVALPFFVRWN